MALRGPSENWDEDLVVDPDLDELEKICLSCFSSLSLEHMYSLQSSSPYFWSIYGNFNFINKFILFNTLGIINISGCILNIGVKLKSFRQFQIGHSVWVRGIRVSLLVIPIQFLLLAIWLSVSYYYEPCKPFIQNWLISIVYFVHNLSLLMFQYSWWVL